MPPNNRPKSKGLKGKGPRGKGPKGEPAKAPHVRLMAPFGMICDECSNAIYKSTKFNAKKRGTDKVYLGIKILSFEIRCPQCSNQVFFETDPQSGGYAIASGAHRMLDPLRNKAAEAESPEAKIRRMAAEKKKDQLESLVTSAQHNMAEAERNREIDELQRLVEQRR